MEPGPEQSFTNTNKPALLTIYSMQPSSKSHFFKVDKSTRPFDMAVAWLRWYGFPINWICQLARKPVSTGIFKVLPYLSCASLTSANPKAEQDQHRSTAPAAPLSPVLLPGHRFRGLLWVVPLHIFCNARPCPL
jgi:hypothetical protein